MVRTDEDRKTVRRYLLQQLSDSEQQALELRLLTDDAVSEELTFVEDELIDQYLGSELSRRERARFEEIFLADATRKQKLQAAKALRRYLDKIPPAPASKSFRWFSLWKGGGGSFFSPTTGAVAAVLAVVVVGFVVWRPVFFQSDLEKGLVALNEAYKQERPIEARTSNSNYALFEITRDGRPQGVNETERIRAELLLRNALKEQPGAASSHAMGQLSLLNQQLDAAIQYLEAARTQDPDNPEIYSDLGAAYLERGKQELRTSGGSDSGKGLEDLGRSLENLKRALELNPNLLPALFNRGLVHWYQKLYGEAEADWRSYLEKDSTSPWANEAQKKLKEAQEKSSSRSHNTGNAFEHFLEAFRAGNDGAAWDIYRRNYGSGNNRITTALVDAVLSDNSTVSSENLKALDYLGQLQLRRTQDPYTSDLARVYSSLTPATQPLLLQARKAVEEGNRLLLLSRIDDGIRLFESALGTFQKLGNLPEALATEAAIAHGATVQPDLVRAQEVLARIMPECETRRYKWLLGEILSERAHIRANLNRYSEALDDSERALKIAQEMRDLSGTLGYLTQLATWHLFLHDNEKSFLYLSRALVEAETERARPMQVWGVHIAVSLNLTARELHRAAFDYQNEALKLALASGLPLYLSRSYQYIGLTYGALKQFDPAFQNMRLAYDQGKALSGQRNGQSIMANASLKLGDLYRAAGDPTSALEAYEESSRLYESLGFHHYSYAAHKGKFLCYLAQNNDALASRELQVVLSLFDDYRTKILSERQKTFFFDREQDVYDLAIDFIYTRLGDPDRAYDQSEICRARSLRELMRQGAEVQQSDSGPDLRPLLDDSAKSAVPLSGAEIVRELPAQVQVVQFTVLEHKLLIWYLKRNKIVPKLVPVKSAELTELVTNTLKQIIRRDENGAAANLKKLHRLLIEPIKDELDPNLVLCLVPDKVLHNVPFGALLSNSSGHYLAQDYRLMLSPSASILIEATRKASERSSIKEERILAVGNPNFDRSVNPRLYSLPSAEREVKEIALLYPTRHRLIGPQATRTALLDELPRANVAHFAAHYEIDPRSVLSSKLLLAHEPGARAHSQPLPAIHPADIYQMRLPRLKVVVLAACKTGIEQQLSGEGPLGFARSFLVAGVPVVVASLWPVESDATAELMIEFHRIRKQEQKSTVEALMRAQQKMIAHENPLNRNPFYWAGFTVIGGHADF